MIPTKNFRWKKAIKRLFFVVGIPQTILFIMAYSVFGIFNPMQTVVGTQEAYDNLKEQHELFSEPITYLTFGLWRFVPLMQIEGELNEIEKKGIKPVEQFIPIWDQIDFNNL